MLFEVVASQGANKGPAWIPIAATAIGLPLLILFAAREQRRIARLIHDNLCGLANRLGLPPPSADGKASELRGQYKGRQVRFWSFTTGSGKSRTTWCAVSVEGSMVTSLTARLEPQTWGSAIEEFFGAKEIVVGDSAFDAAWFIRTNQADFLRPALLPEIRARLTESHRDQRSGKVDVARGSRYVVENGTARYEVMGRLADDPTIARLEHQLPVLFDLADIASVAREM